MGMVTESSAAGDADHLLARHHLDAFADHVVQAFGPGPGSTEACFVGVEPVPALPCGVFDAALFQQVDNRLRVRVLGRGQGQPVFEEETDGFQGVALGVADQADGAALDPAGGVDCLLYTSPSPRDS